MALQIAEAYGEEVDRLVVELGALLHDYMDHKYTTAKDAVKAEEVLRGALKEAGLDRDRRDLVVKIVKNVGYSRENKMKANGEWTTWHETCKEFHCVQDADRLDAIGGIGIMRVAAFSGAHGQPLYDPSDCDIISHFREKLLSLKDTIRTPVGRRVAAQRQAIMEAFVESCTVEAELDDFDAIPVSA
jgi:uncharacterized protein